MAQRIAGESFCILKQRPNPSGRILTMKGTVHGFEDFTVDLCEYW